MLEKFTSANAADFRQRYAQTYGWLHSSTKRFVYVSDVERTVTHFEDVNGTPFNVKLDSALTFEFIPVTNGYYYGKDNKIYYLQRVPARQWRRGICDANTNILDINGFNIAMNIKVLDNIFGVDEQPYTFIADAACALSRHFAITDDHEVKFRNRVIGKRDKNKLIVDPIFYQEIVDTNRRLGFKFTVEGK